MAKSPTSTMVFHRGMVVFYLKSALFLNRIELFQLKCCKTIFSTYFDIDPAAHGAWNWHEVKMCQNLKTSSWTSQHHGELIQHHGSRLGWDCFRHCFGLQGATGFGKWLVVACFQHILAGVSTSVQSPKMGQKWWEFTRKIYRNTPYLGKSHGFPFKSTPFLLRVPPGPMAGTLPPRLPVAAPRWWWVKRRFPGWGYPQIIHMNHPAIGFFPFQETNKC